MAIGEPYQLGSHGTYTGLATSMLDEELANLQAESVGGIIRPTDAYNALRNIIDDLNNYIDEVGAQPGGPHRLR
jgi:hypothetical protein